MSELLSEQEMAKWVAWKRATTAVMDAVVADITATTGLSSADFSVLTRVIEEGGGSIRQQRLSDDLGWERSRLSKQVVRMEQRGLVRREGTTAERRIVATDRGRAVGARARQVHAGAVRRHLIDALPAANAHPFWAALRTLGEHGRGAPGSDA